jgi:2-polyprenyl-3-methyl-5-hydroxy-6-metoxy-1,4-benzoquinol methylase
MKDSWQSGDSYEYYMGRWSKLVANQFVDWLLPKAGRKWLDVGCGTGALSEAIINRHHPETVVAIDQSEGFVRAAQQSWGQITVLAIIHRIRDLTHISCSSPDSHKRPTPLR